MPILAEKSVEIVKSTGEREAFDQNKLRSSLRRAGARESSIDTIVKHIYDELKDGMSTGEIYRHAYHRLHDIEHPVALKYSLRRAIFDLGPTGYPFENYVAEIYKARGYKAKTRIFVKGACSTHEIDCLAWNENQTVLVEAKFHQTVQMGSDLKVALYVKARFDDLKNAEIDCNGHICKMTEGLLITNTKFSHTAINYSACARLSIIGWNYPREGNLHDLIENHGLHPITCLSTLSPREKGELLGRGIVLCKSIAEDTDVLRMVTGINEGRIEKVLEEVRLIAHTINVPRV